MKRHTQVFTASLLLLSSNYPALANDDLQRYLPPDQLVWLDDGGDNRFLALHNESMASFARGQLVHLPDWTLHPLQSTVISQSYQHSADSGWESWAILPPAIPLESHQLSQGQAQSVFPQVVDESFFDPHVEALQQRMERLNERLQQAPGFNVWVVEGITAAIVVKLLTRQPQLMPDGLVVVNMYLPQMQLNKAVSRQLAQLQLPLLELHSESANTWVVNSQKLRHQFSQKYQQISFRQRTIMGQGSVAERSYNSQLEGWLRHQGF